jgi:hypothetical protein
MDKSGITSNAARSKKIIILSGIDGLKKSQT